MPHVKAAKGAGIVNLDNGISVNEYSSINVDVTLPLAVAALAADPPTIVELDSTAAPIASVTAGGVPLPIFTAVVTDASFASPPPVGSQALALISGTYYAYFKFATGVWKRATVS